MMMLSSSTRNNDGTSSTNRRSARSSLVLPFVIVFCSTPIVLLLSMILYKLDQMTINDLAAYNNAIASSSSPLSAFVSSNTDGMEGAKSHPDGAPSSANATSSWSSSSSIFHSPHDYRPAPPNLPSIQSEKSSKVRAWTTVRRRFYGGKGDEPHLGGFTDLDMSGISPAVWRHMVEDWGIHSVMDVGCGRGLSTLWFHLHNLTTLCVEGSHDAVQQSVIPSQLIVEHDYSRGPWWPSKTFDAVWSVEFLEHVGINYHFNYISTFRKAAVLIVTSSSWGGWHHVEVHKDGWWVRKYRSYGFLYEEKLTRQVREWGDEEHSSFTKGPHGLRYQADHLRRSAKVFVNPAVASLPQHAHLFFEHGCYQDKRKPNRPCNGTKKRDESTLPQEYLPLVLDPTVQQQWEKMVEANTKPQKSALEKLAKRERKRRNASAEEGLQK